MGSAKARSTFTLSATLGYNGRMNPPLINTDKSFADLMKKCRKDASLWVQYSSQLTQMKFFALVRKAERYDDMRKLQFLSYEESETRLIPVFSEKKLTHSIQKEVPESTVIELGGQDLFEGLIHTIRSLERLMGCKAILDPGTSHSVFLTKEILVAMVQVF